MDALLGESMETGVVVVVAVDVPGSAFSSPLPLSLLFSALFAFLLYVAVPPVVPRDGASGPIPAGTRYAAARARCVARQATSVDSALFQLRRVASERRPFESHRLTLSECASTKLTKSLSSGRRQGLFLVMRLPRGSSEAMPKRASVRWTLVLFL